MREQSLERRKAELEAQLQSDEGFVELQRQVNVIMGDRKLAPMPDIATLYQELVRIILEHEFPPSAADSPITGR